MTDSLLASLEGAERGDRVYLTDAPEEALERICEAQWANPGTFVTVHGVTFHDIHRHDACNHTLSGVVDIGGVSHGFVIDNGNNSGTVVREWGNPEDVGIYDPGPPPEPRTFVPTNDALAWERPGMFGVYLAWRKEPWFTDMERSYNYDRHFQPGSKVESHYREKAAKRGLKTGYLSDLTAAIAHLKASANPKPEGEG